MRGFLILLALAAVWGYVPSAAAAADPPSRWCGNASLTAADRDDPDEGEQFHVIYAIPADSEDRFAQMVLPIVHDIAAIDAWWRTEADGRAPRLDFLHVECDTVIGRLDISSVKLDLAGARVAAADVPAFLEVMAKVRERGFNSSNKKYLVYYDGPVTPTIQCGRSDTPSADVGNVVAVVLLQNRDCGTLGAADDLARVALHEVLHSFGAVPKPAPHACAEVQHVCGDEVDIMSERNVIEYIGLARRRLDPGRDDYYGHNGSWLDVADSRWLGSGGQELVTLAVGVGAGGSVTNQKVGIDCPSTCSATVVGGSRVQLRAVATDGFVFSGWKDTPGCDGLDPCTVTVDRALTVGASFTPTTKVTVSVADRGSGVVFVQPGSDLAEECKTVCAWSLLPGAVVRIEASPTEGYRFNGWKGACSGTRQTCSFTVGTAPMMATARFITQPVADRPPRIAGMAFVGAGKSTALHVRVCDGTRGAISLLVRTANGSRIVKLVQRSSCQLHVTAGTWNGAVTVQVRDARGRTSAPKTVRAA